MKYKVNAGKRTYYTWENNIVLNKSTLPLRLDEEKNHCLNTKEKIFSLQSLDEYINPPHKIGDVILFTERQALDIIEKLRLLVKTDFEKLAERKLKNIQRISTEKEAKKE